MFDSTIVAHESADRKPPAGKSMEREFTFRQLYVKIKVIVTIINMRKHAERLYVALLSMSIAGSKREMPDMLTKNTDKPIRWQVTIHGNANE
jgi:hypothetical protein